LKNPNVRQLARFSSPETLPGTNRILLERNLAALWGANSELDTENHARISNRLTYVQQLLNLRPTPHLNEAQISNRTHLLYLLGRYADRGVFPKDYEQHSGARLCFKDEDGRRCAVGFLIEQTHGRDLADRICGTHIDLMDGHTRLALSGWMRVNGVNEEELALIQPGFQPKGDVATRSGISHRFSGLREASMRDRAITPREDGFAAIVSRESEQKSDSQLTFTTIFDLLHTPSAQADPVKVFVISNQWGEPALAMTFSRNL
jgi:hypothetical protein